jgi:hypothetical protein
MLAPSKRTPRRILQISLALRIRLRFTFKRTATVLPSWFEFSAFISTNLHGWVTDNVAERASIFAGGL